MDCYAADLGDCAGGKSAEHYISRSVLELVGLTVHVAGMPWQASGERQEIGISSLTSGILCRHHNEQLSDLDSEGRAYVLALKSAFDLTMAGQGLSQKDVRINGDHLERWLLKVLSGILVVAKGCSTIPRAWLEILFKGRPFPENAGMSFFAKMGETSWYFNLLSMIPVLNKQGKIVGAKFGIGGLPVILGFGKPEFEDAEMRPMFRPSCLEIRVAGRRNRIMFDWAGDLGGGTITLEYKGRLDQEDGGPLPLVKPP